MVLLESSDNQQFKVDTKVMLRSKLIKNVVEDIGDFDDQAIPLPNVTASVLEKVLPDFRLERRTLSIHLAGNRILQSPPDNHNVAPRRTVEFSEWDSKFLALDKETLLEITHAANYLDISSLLKACCTAWGEQIKGKSAEEIRELFNIENDFTPEEEEKIKEECKKWAN